MLRFLSRRRGRSVSGQQTSSQIKNQRLLSSKHIVQCRVILLDGADLPIDLSVSAFLFFFVVFVSLLSMSFCFEWDLWFFSVRVEKGTGQRLVRAGVL